MSERLNISGHYGSTNTLNDHDYYKLICDTSKYIYDLLTSHCGPYATDTLIITDNHKNLKDRHNAIFTKDGINIVRSIEFQSPIQKHIQSLVAYIGERVDSLSHDGTTTSMMLFTKLLELYFTMIHAEEPENPNGNNLFDRRGLKKNVPLQLKALLSKLEENVITLDKLQKDFTLTKAQATRFVAYHQAMLSSKSDIELSEAISEVVETLPVEMYGLFSVSQSGMETDKRFTVIKDDYNFMLPVQWDLDDMNHAMGTEYLAECCDLIVCEDGLVPGNLALEILVKYIATMPKSDDVVVQFECEEVDLETGSFVIKDQKNELDAIIPGSRILLAVNGNPLKDGFWIYNGPDRPVTRPEPKKDLVIIAKSLDPNLMSHIKLLNRKNEQKIVVYTMSVPNPYSSKATVLSALLNTAGVYHLSEHLADPSKPYVIKDAKVHFKSRRLFVSNLYKKDGTQYHPFYNNPDAFEPYTQMVKEIKQYLDDATSGKVRFQSDSDRFRYEDYVEIYRRMVCAEVRQLQISGLTHDVLHDRDILQDSFGAVLSSLENGFILDGYLKLNMIIQSEVEFNSPFLKTALFDVLQATHKIDPEQIKTIISAAMIPNVSDIAKIYQFYPCDSDGLVELLINPDDLTEIVDNLDNKQILVMQPADTYRELFKRLMDLLPKMINTNRAIIPGTVNEGKVK